MIVRGSARRGAMKRREFLALGGAAAAAAALAACTPTSGAPSSTVAADPSVLPKRGGTLTWAQILDNTLIDLPAISTASAMEIGGNLSDSLVSIDTDLNTHPWLATKWS